MNMLRGSIGKPIDGQNQLDVMLKGIGKSMIYGGRTLLYFTLGMEPISAIMRATILTGAVMQSVRLFIDIPRNVIYSV